jgi:hypothetical protein
MKSAGKRARLRRTCSFKRLVSTPFNSAKSLSSITFSPRRERIALSIRSTGTKFACPSILCLSPEVVTICDNLQTLKVANCDLNLNRSQIVTGSFEMPIWYFKKNCPLAATILKSQIVTSSFLVSVTAREGARPTGALGTARPT